MLTVENFNQSDLKRLEAIPQSFKLIIILFIIFCVPGSFLFGLLGLTKKGYGYWHTTLSLLAVFFILALFSIMKDYILYIRDKKRQQKYTGIITIVKKSTKKGEKIIFTDAPQIRKLNLFEQAQFDKIAIGDELTIEISRFTKTILRLEKGSTDLLNSN